MDSGGFFVALLTKVAPMSAKAKKEALELAQEFQSTSYATDEDMDADSQFGDTTEAVNTAMITELGPKQDEKPQRADCKVEKRHDETMRFSLPVMTLFGSQSWIFTVWQIHFLVISLWPEPAVMQKLSTLLAHPSRV
jgi:hypothetical protein